MLAFRPFFSLHFTFSKLFPPFSSSLSLHFPKFNLHKSPIMSSSKPPSAFDALMSNARAAASKNKKPLSQSHSKSETKPHSPSKRKTLEPITKTLDSDESKKDENAKEKGWGLKKVKGEDRVAELKSNISLLKKKAKEFDPKLVAYWDKGEKVPFAFVCLAFDLIDKETGRIVITDIVCNMLRTVMDTTPEDLVAVVYLLGNRIAPAHQGVELGIGEAMLIKALAEACGRTEKEVKKQYKDMGDLGLVAKASRSSQSMMRKPEALTIAKVFSTFQLIAKESGKDSQDRKKNHIKALLVAATDCEPQYLIRLLQSKLRIGLAEQTLLAALGQAAVYTEEHSRPPADIQSPLEEAAKIVKRVYSVLPVYDTIVSALLSYGVWNLPEHCKFTPGIPIGPMLAKPTKAVSEIVDKFQNMEFACEYKYDGERAQIHYMENGSVEIYSRNAERNTEKYPDVVVAVSRLKKPSVKSFVLDCELVAYDREKMKILPFQVLSTRPRKNVVMSEIKTNVCIFAFDILHLNGEPLIQEQLNIRRERLYSAFEEEPGFLQFATAITSSDLEEIQKFLDAAVGARFISIALDICFKIKLHKRFIALESSCSSLAIQSEVVWPYLVSCANFILTPKLQLCEGLIIKTLNKDATYEPSKRSNNWLKLKKDYMESIGDSIDLVPIGAFHGRGKRTGVYGAFLLACYDKDNEEFQSTCKIGTGFSEAMLEERSSSLRAKVIPQPKSYYRHGDAIVPDVWFEPTEVWEVKAADLTSSPVYHAAIGQVDSGKGISLRFPRLLRVRTDKEPEDATTSEQIAEMYNSQNHNHSNNQDEDEDD